MTKEQKIEAKQRIYNAAVSLFARKGYDAVGTREIAKSANVNISMINYYYKGKVGILKEIVNLGFKKYYDLIKEITQCGDSLEDQVLKLVRGLIKLHRENLELMIVSLSVAPIGLPEIQDLRYNLSQENREGINAWFRQLGANLSDNAQMTLIRSFLSTVIFRHFENEYFWELIKQAPAKPKYLETPINEQECEEIADEDEFYDRYADMLAEFYLQGMRAVARKYNKGG
jgi:AcrR family transcriptional regulator